MPKFRKKPVVIEVDAERYWDNMAIPPDGVLNFCSFLKCSGRGVPHIHSWKGTLLVSNGDWITTTATGEKDSCKPDIFEKTYNLVDRVTENVS